MSLLSDALVALSGDGAASSVSQVLCLLLPYKALGAELLSWAEVGVVVAARTGRAFSALGVLYPWGVYALTGQAEDKTHRTSCYINGNPLWVSPLPPILEHFTDIPSKHHAISCSPRFESIHFISTGARRRERPRPVAFILIGCCRHDGRGLSSSCVCACAASSHRQLLHAAIAGKAVHGLAGRSPVAGVVVGGGGVDAAVVGAPLAQWVRVGIGWVAPADPASSLSSVKPALVAVVAGGVAGQGVAAGVAGVLSLPLESTARERSGLALTNQQAHHSTDL